MSEENDPGANLAPPVLLPPNCHPEPPLEPHLMPPGLTPEECRDSENRAHQDLACIEHQARLQSRLVYPLVPLPRAQSNIRSVKRTRFVRKEVERVVTEKIREKLQRIRELDRLLEIERQNHIHVRRQAEELQKLPNLESELVRVEHETPEHLMQEFLAGMDAKDDDNPNITPPPLQLPEQHDHFEAEYGNLANNLYDFRPLNDALPDCEPTLDPGLLLDPLSDPPEELECNFLLGEGEPNQNQPENQHAVNLHVVNQEHDDQDLENNPFLDVF